MQTKHLCVLIHIWTKGEVGVTRNRFKPSSKIFYWLFQGGTYFVDLLCFFCFVFAMPLCSSVYILGQKRNAAYKTFIVYGGLSPISRKQFVTVWALILGLWVPGVVLAIIVTGRNWFSSLNLRFYGSWRRVIRRWRHECAQSDIVPICQKRFPRRSIILAWHQNCWAITDGATLACNILIVFSRSTCVSFGIVN